MKTKLIKSFIGLPLIITGMGYAAGNTDVKTFKSDSKISSKACYTENCIGTPELQKEVEKLSKEGKLPFEMGLELIKRWSAKA